MAVALVQNLASGVVLSAGALSLPPHAGTDPANLLVLAIGAHGATSDVFSVADTRGNTWTRDVAADTSSSASATALLEVWSTQQDVAALSTSDRISVSVTGATPSVLEAWGWEWSGVDIVDASDRQIGLSASAAISPAPTVTTIGAGDLVIGMICLPASAGPLVSEPVGWTTLTTPGGAAFVGGSKAASMLAGGWQAPIPPETLSWAPSVSGALRYQAALVALKAAPLIGHATVSGVVTVHAGAHALKPGHATVAPSAVVSAGGLATNFNPILVSATLSVSAHLLKRGQASVRANATVHISPALLETGLARVLVAATLSAQSLLLQAFTLQIDPGEMSAPGRVMLDLNADPIRVDQAGIDFGDAQIQAYLADQNWGSVPVSFRVPNRTVSIPLAIAEQPLADLDFAAASEALREKVGLLQREGGVLKRGAATPLYADIVSASLHFPDKWGEVSGVETGLSLALECLPDFYGPPVTLDPLSATAWLTGVLSHNGQSADIEGDHPARCQILVSDTSGQDQHGLLWALRGEHYDPAAPSVYQAEALSPISPASPIRAPGASAGRAVSHPSLTSAWTPILSTGALSHVGSYQVWARVYSAASVLPELSLVWQQASTLTAGTENEPVAIPGQSAWYLVNLGQIDVGRAAAPGAQDKAAGASWTGTLYGRCLQGSASALIDVLLLQCLDEAAGQVMATPGNPNYATPGTPVSYASRTMALQSAGMVRGETDGVSFAPLGMVLGDLPRLPPSGLEGRPIELLLKPSRGDLQSLADSGLDPFTVALTYWPSYLFHP